MKTFEQEVSKSMTQHYDGLVQQDLESLMPIPKSITSIEALNKFISMRKDKYLSGDPFSIEHLDCDIEGCYDSLLFYIAQGVISTERERAAKNGGKYRAFKPLVVVSENDNEYQRPYKLSIDAL